MPISRKRRPRRSSSSQRERDRRRARRRARPREAVRVSLADLIEQGPDDVDLFHLEKSLEAGADGDVHGSLKHELSRTLILGDTHRFAVKELADLGDAAPAWAYSRWCLDLAYRWLLLSGDPRTDAAVRLVTPTLHPESLERAEDPSALRVLCTMVAAADPIVEDVVLFEMGGLGDYLDGVARAGLLERTDRVAQWSGAAPGVYAFREMRGCRLVLTDLVTDEEVEVLNVGALSGVDDDHLIGRLVPISAEPGLMFASRPIPISEATAEHVLDELRSGEPLGWLFALHLSLEHGHETERFHHVGRTPFTSDLPFMQPDDSLVASDDAPYVAELRSRGHSQEVANALGVLCVAQAAASVCDSSAAAAGPHAAAALTTPGVLDAARRECTSPESAPAWDVLAAVVPEHVAQMCRDLAAVARGAAR